MNKKETRKRNSKTGIQPDKKGNVENFKDKNLVTEDEWKLREQRQLQRIQDVKVCLDFIAESVDGYNKLLLEQSTAQVWNRYLSCDGIPRVEYPGEIRTMIAEMRHFEAKSVASVIDWELSVDESSILSQNVNRKDLTRRTLEETVRPDIGQLYAKDVERILKTLKRIELLLANDYEIRNIPPVRAMDILTIRQELNQEIGMLFDRLTYRITCAPSNYRTSYDGIMETYCYEDSNYNLQIWWLSNVPIRFNYLELPLMLAKLDCVGIKIQIPLSVLGDNLALRCVHTFFDHLSEDAKSYDQLIDVSARFLNGGIMDIEDCLINEWVMQLNIMDNLIATVEEKIMEYEGKLREIELKEALSRNEKNSDKRQNKKKKERKAVDPKKSLKEPDTFPNGMFPDPYSKFLELEQSEFTEFLDEYLSPKNLNLKSNEINLRCYNIVGGIYSMTFVRKPKNAVLQKLNVTLHEDRRILYTLEDVRAEVSSESGRKNSKKRSLSEMKHAHYAQALEALENQHLNLKPDELPFFNLTFKLPDYLCRFGEPLPCQFIEEEVEEEMQEPLITEEEVRSSIRRRAPKKNAYKDNDVSRESSIVSKHADIRAVLPRPSRKVIVPKSVHVKNIYRPTTISILRQSAIQNLVPTGVHLRDFQVMGKPLTVTQMHNVERHCMPRILSTFKFPLEFRLERNEELAEKARDRGCVLFRRQYVEPKSIVDDEPEYFNFDKQESPERIYPIFNWREQVIWQEETSSEVDSHDDLGAVNMKVAKIDKISATTKGADSKEFTMFGVLETLYHIEDQYKARPLKIMDQPNFASKGLRLSSINEAHEEKQNVRSRGTPRKLSRSSRTGETPHSSIEKSFDMSSCSSNDTISMRRTLSKNYETTENEMPRKELPKVKHWTTKYIQRTEYLPDSTTFKIQTDRLGLFGFAYKRYEHFPFKMWSLQYNEANNNEIVFTLDTFHVRVILYITNAGIRGYVTKITSEYVAHPVKYMEIAEPISDYRELRRRFCEKNINIFAERDACYYIENGYFSEKHLATELHIYDAFAIHCKLIKFYRSDWNRLATRRNMALCLRNPKDINDGADVTIRVTPDSSTFVEISEACSDDTDIVKLNYNLTWRNISTYSDVHQLINSMYPQATDLRNRDPKLIHYIRTLFTEVRPLSFS